VSSLINRLAALFTSPLGVFALAGLDSTLFVSLPFGIDTAVIVLAARSGGRWWLVALLAMTGSVVGAALTFWMGVKIGENGLERYVSARRLDQVRARIKRSGALALAVLDLIPPPFPFTPFVLAAGALDVNASFFFLTLMVCRIVRFGLEAALAQAYGRQILAVEQSAGFRTFVFALIALALALTALSGIQLVRSARAHRRVTET
jgi:membrane protein YqaA with SNARE-associated domain